MELQAFKDSLLEDAPPAGLGGELQALWHEAKGDWHKAHKLAQAESGATAEWVHAYLHRVEGDMGNAGYWYRRCGKPFCETSLEAEWEEIAAALLAAAGKTK